MEPSRGCSTTTAISHVGAGRCRGVREVAGPLDQRHEIGNDRPVRLGPFVAGQIFLNCRMHADVFPVLRKG